MVQAVTDAVEPDGGAGRSIWEGTPFPNEVPGRGREEKRQERRETQRERKDGGRKTERGSPAFMKWRQPHLQPLLMGLFPCRPHAVDTGARAAVAGVGDKGVRLDGDRHSLFPEHGWQGTV